MRIISGKFKGTQLKPPQNNLIRPTTDRVRETIFNVLIHQANFTIENARVLDLFAGSGANGLEAISRGAKYCLFIDSSASSRALIRTNIEKLNLEGLTKIYRRDSTRLGIIGNLKPFDLIFLDPPYRKGLGELALISAYNGNWLAPKSFCVLEEDSKSNIDIPNGFKIAKSKICGDSQLLFLNQS